MAERFQAHRGGTAEAMAVMVQERLDWVARSLAAFCRGTSQMSLDS